MKALLFTVDFPPNKGGVSRYYEGLVEVSGARIGVAGIDLGEDEQRFVLLADLMARMARASNVNHFIGDKSSVINDGNEALQEY